MPVDEPGAVRPESVEELVALIRDADEGANAFVPRGGGSKPALTAPGAESTVIDMGRLTGILAYEPSEFTISVRAGTPLADVDAALRENGQALPFDPPWVDVSGQHGGSTAGGAVAAGLSGPGSLRGGGLRDAVLAVRFVDGRGRHARAGAPVVKNAAGFDLPKLFVGGLGRLSILTEITFKVLPAPAAFSSASILFPSLDAARRAVVLLLASPFELASLDISRDSDDNWQVVVRVGGGQLDRRLQRIASHLGQPVTRIDHGIDDGIDDAAFWRDRRDVTWAPADRALVWIPITAGRVLAFDSALRDLDATTVYGGGLSHAWTSLEASALPALDALLHRLDLAGLLIRGGSHGAIDPVLGRMPGRAFLRRVKRALDPHDRFLSFQS